MAIVHSNKVVIFGNIFYEPGCAAPVKHRCDAPFIAWLAAEQV
jgi:hypothetical protein